MYHFTLVIRHDLCHCESCIGAFRSCSGCLDNFMETIKWCCSQLAALANQAATMNKQRRRTDMLWEHSKQLERGGWEGGIRAFLSSKCTTFLKKAYYFKFYLVNKFVLIKLFPPSALDGVFQLISIVFYALIKVLVIGRKCIKNNQRSFFFPKWIVIIRGWVSL